MILKGGTHDMKLGQTILDIRKERKELSGFRNSDFYER